MFALAAFLAATLPANADVIETESGSVLHGRVVSSEDGLIKFDTEFAGLLLVKQSQVKSIITDNPVFVELKNGDRVKGWITKGESNLSVVGDNGTFRADPGAIVSLWREGDKSPAQRQAESLTRRWAYELGVDLNGKRGNSERLFFGVRGRAEMKTVQDRLFFYGSYAQADDSGRKTQDEGKFGVDYSNYFVPPWSWYVRQELGFDGTKDLDLRSQTAVGIGRSLLKKANHTLEARVGIAYRFENYGNGTDFDSAGLEFGVLHSFSLRFGKMNNSLTVTPSFDNFNNYVLTHESSLEIPVAQSEAWKIRLGVKNDYTSRPPNGLKPHDWSYISQLVFTWR